MHTNILVGVCVIVIISLCNGTVYAEQILNLPKAVERSCAIVRGRVVYLASTSAYDKGLGFDVEHDDVWTLDITAIYRWEPPSYRWNRRREQWLRVPSSAAPKRDDIPKRIIFVVNKSVETKYDNEVILFLSCHSIAGHYYSFHRDYSASSYIWTRLGWPVKVYEEEEHGVKRMFINGWTIKGLGKGKIPLGDFEKAVKKLDQKRNTKKSKSTDDSTFVIKD